MNLQEILTQIDERVPNTVTTARKVQILNEKQNHLFREFPVPDAVDRFETLAGQAFYSLPSDCAPDQIRTLLVGGVPYVYRSLNDEYDGRPFWTTVQGTLMLYPTPADVREVQIYYTPRANTLSENNLTVEPSFPSDYHMLLVYSGCVEVAKLNMDANLANVYQADYDELFKTARRHLNKKPQPRVIRAGVWR